MNGNQALFQEIARIQAEYAVPGMALSIVYQGQSETFCNGLTNINNPVAVNEATLFQIASITKTLSALLVLRLCTEHIIDLDVPIIQYLPDFYKKDRRVTQELTVRHILALVGGWEGDLLTYPDQGEDTLKAAMSLVAQLPQLTPLGRYGRIIRPDFMCWAMSWSRFYTCPMSGYSANMY